MRPVNVRCEGLGRVVEGRPGDNLMRLLLAAGVPVGTACEGDGVCGRCGLEVLAGDAGAEGAVERRSKERNRVDPTLRLSCCVTVSGDLVVRARYW